MRIFPFTGTRYASTGGDPGRLAAPPYDQIDDELRRRLHAEELQFCQLTVPDPDGRPDPAHHSAALHHGSWAWMRSAQVAKTSVRQTRRSLLALAGIFPGQRITNGTR